MPKKFSNTSKKVMNQLKMLLPPLNLITRVTILEEVTTEVEEVAEDFPIVEEPVSLQEGAEEEEGEDPARDGCLKDKPRNNINTKMIRSNKIRKLTITSRIVDSKGTIIKGSSTMREAKIASRIIDLTIKRKEKTMKSLERRLQIKK